MSQIDASNADSDRLGVLDQDTRPHLHVAVDQKDAPRSEFDCARWTDSQLVFAATDVRDAAFAELFSRHSSSVAAVARTILGTAGAGCDDVVAEVFAAMWSAPQKFVPERGSLLGFLRVQARGRSLDLLRSESSRHQRERKAERDSKPSSTMDAGIIAAETGQRLRDAVSRLPEAERTAIELAYFAGMSYQAVALQLELPEGTVKSRIRSALQRLRTEVDIDDCVNINVFANQNGTSLPRSRQRGAFE